MYGVMVWMCVGIMCVAVVGDGWMKGIILGDGAMSGWDVIVWEIRDRNTKRSMDRH